MRILSLALEHSKFFLNTTSLPYQGEIIFDPASYGQFLNGTDLKRGSMFLKEDTFQQINCRQRTKIKTYFS